jgi:hypothetical protein
LTGLQGKANDFTLGYKSGYYNIISSMQVDYDGKTVQQLTPNLNYYVNFKMNTSMSMSTVETLGSTLGIYPDTPDSWVYNNGGANVRGNGVVNSNIIDANLYGPDAPYTGSSHNAGAQKRRLSTSFRTDTKGAPIKNLANNTQELLTYTTGTNAYQAYYTTMIIRLRDVSDFFAQMPLTKGFYARLTINLNLGSFLINSPNNANHNMHLYGSSINFPNGTCPLMIRENTVAQFEPTVLEIVGGIYCRQVTASLGTRNQSTLNVPAHTLNSCRIYAPNIDLQPARALSYIQENRSKYIEWDDIYAAQVTGVGANSSFNYNITNSLPGIKAMVIIPFISGTVNGIDNTNTNSAFSPCRSPFTTEPSTTSPLLSLTNFNVQLAGENVLANNINYAFEEFIEQLAPANSLNGGQSLGLTSGLIDQYAFQNVYRYYYVDLSRRSKDDVGNKGITIVGQNNNLLAIDLFCFVIHKKSASLDVETGKFEMRV